LAAFSAAMVLFLRCDVAKYVTIAISKEAFGYKGKRHGD
jgi:hypothetical protein